MGRGCTTTPRSGGRRCRRGRSRAHPRRTRPRYPRRWCRAVRAAIWSFRIVATAADGDHDQPQPPHRGVGETPFRPVHAASVRETWARPACNGDPVQRRLALHPGVARVDERAQRLGDVDRRRRCALLVRGDRDRVRGRVVLGHVRPVRADLVAEQDPAGSAWTARSAATTQRAAAPGLPWSRARGRGGSSPAPASAPLRFAARSPHRQTSPAGRRRPGLPRPRPPRPQPPAATASAAGEPESTWDRGFRSIASISSSRESRSLNGVQTS